MKKIIQIPEGMNAITLKAKPATQAGYIKIFNSQNQLIRHSRSKLNDHIISAPPGKYFIETDGNFEVGEERDLDTTKSMKSLYKHLEIDLPNNMLTLRGKPFYQTDDLATFINRMVQNKEELRGYFEGINEKAVKKARKNIWTNEKAAAVLLGVGTTTEKNKLKKRMADIAKEGVRIRLALKKAKNAGEMLKVVPKVKIPLTN